MQRKFVFVTLTLWVFINFVAMEQNLKDFITKSGIKEEIIGELTPEVLLGFRRELRESKSVGKFISIFPFLGLSVYFDVSCSLYRM